MKLLTSDQLVGIAATAVAAAVLLWLWGTAPWVPAWPVVAAAAGILAAAVVWLSVLPGRPTDGWWALAALAVAAESAWEYGALPTEAWPFQAAAWVPSLIAAGLGSRADGWKTGLRIGMGSALVATAGLAVVFGAWVGQPVQATVLEASGALVRFSASTSTDFLVWAVADFWSSVPLRLVLGAFVGAGLGYLARVISNRVQSASLRIRKPQP